MAVVHLRPSDLREALASGGTSLQFQVQVHVPTRTLAGAESLVRWPHPVLGMIGPQEIVQLVDQGGMHSEFDSWIIARSCAQAAAWRGEGVPLPLVAVNVFEVTLRRRTLDRAVETALDAASAPAEMLEIELPRGAGLDTSLATTIAALRARGVRIAVDAREVADIPEIDIDTVKLPLRLTADLADPERSATAKAVVDAAKARGLRVVAEGIETEALRDLVMATGCDIVQGYVFGPEVSAAEVSELATKA
jgi:EAL domain-containing protein (putative c-di-GMP-specific phosphodiesterase class I)